MKLALLLLVAFALTDSVISRRTKRPRPDGWTRPPRPDGWTRPPRPDGWTRPPRPGGWTPPPGGWTPPPGGWTPPPGGWTPPPGGWTPPPGGWTPPPGGHTGGPTAPPPTNDTPPPTDGPTNGPDTPPPTDGPDTPDGGSGSVDIVACTSDSGCECGDTSQGFQTYTFNLNGQQRCFTTYIPLSRQGEVLPVMFAPNCYATDRLQGLGATSANSNDNKAAARYGFARVFVSTPDRNWVFGNDQIVNDDKPMPCADEDSKDIAYIRKIIEWINSQGDKFDSSRMYSAGFSQNSMFSAYIAFCFNDQFKGVWQGGSGLTLKGKEPYVPNCGGQLAASTFAECGKACGQCVKSYTCEDCQYWPIYPCYSPIQPLAHCIAEYTNDNISVGKSDPEGLSSSRNMYERSLKEGHEARLLRFSPSSDSTIKGNHKSPQNSLYWRIGCMGVTAPCSAACEASFVACVAEQGASTALEQANAFGTCIKESKFKSLSGCTSECAPTFNMLATSEVPTTAEVATFGAAANQAEAQPSDSQCSQ